MANFNEKVMSLFRKNRAQLLKEAQRRGIVYKNDEQVIAEIIWKDAYDAGINDGKHSLTKNQTLSTKLYVFHDNLNRVDYRISANRDQVNAIQWVIDTINDQVYELTEWNNDFVDVGRI